MFLRSCINLLISFFLTGFLTVEAQEVIGPLKQLEKNIEKARNIQVSSEINGEYDPNNTNFYLLQKSNPSLKIKIAPDFLISILFFSDTKYFDFMKSRKKQNDCQFYNFLAAELLKRQTEQLLFCYQIRKFHL